MVRYVFRKGSQSKSSVFLLHGIAPSGLFHVASPGCKPWTNGTVAPRWLADDAIFRSGSCPDPVLDRWSVATAECSLNGRNGVIGALGKEASSF